MQRLCAALLLLIFHLQAIAQNFQQLTDSLKAMSVKYDLVGMSMVGVYKNKIVYKQHFGERDIERHLLVNDSSLFRIASISKNICTTALLKLYEAGKLKLDEDIQTYLGYPIRNPKHPDIPITLRMLLSHTSTLNDGEGYGNFLDSTGAKPYAFNVQQLVQSTGTFYTKDMFTEQGEPGKYFTYANINFGLVGCIIEKVSQQRYDLFIQDQIFKPLGIVASNYVNNLPNINNVGAIYRKQDGTWKAQVDNHKGNYPTPKNLHGYQLGQNAIVFSPTGGVRISALDLAKYMQMLMNKGSLNGTKILNDTTISLMQKQQWLYDGSNGRAEGGLFRAWGLGTYISTNTPLNDVIFSNKKMLGHSGDAYGLISNMFYDPIQQFGYVFIINGSGKGYKTSVNSAFYEQEEKTMQILNNALFSQYPELGIQKIQYQSDLIIVKHPEKNEITYSLSKAWMNKEVNLLVENVEGKILLMESVKYEGPQTLLITSTNSDFYILKISANKKRVSARFSLN
jgi:CubicO group peptidase (beta-lactamase class C family)